MSVYTIYRKDGGAKMMRPILTRKEYLELRDSKKQHAILKAVREGDVGMKRRLVEMSYSCLPNADGSLAGTTRLSSTVGMDIDFVAPQELSADEQQAWLAEQMAGVPAVVLGKKDALGLLMLERSASKGYHLVFRRREGLSQDENLEWASKLLGVKFDKGAKDITRVFFTTTASSDDLLYLDDALFDIVEMSAPHNAPRPAAANGNAPQPAAANGNAPQPAAANGNEPSPQALTAFDLCAEQAGLNPLSMDVWGEHNWHTNLMAVLSVGVGKLMSREQLNAVVAVRLPNYSTTDDCRKLIDYFYEKYSADKGFMNTSLREINAKVQMVAAGGDDATADLADGEGDDAASDGATLLNTEWKKLPMGIRDSIDAVGPQLAMPVVTAICPCIGALATGVVLDVHGDKKGLNLISYIAGDFASGKGKIDPVVESWMSEVQALDNMYLKQEEEYGMKKRAAMNKKDQPEELKLPVRCLTLNSTVAKLADRLANTRGKHAFSFTPEADTVAQKWKSSMCDFSVMLRQSYDGSKYDREAKSVDAVNVHIPQLLWNVTMCGTPDALYRVVSNYTDGFQSRIAVARTPDNTFAPLEDKPWVLTDRHRDHIQQVAHLLPLMQGEVVLPKLEQKGREWVERMRLETMKNYDKVGARQRIRTCVTAQRMTCCLMLCRVCETLIQKYGLSGAETRLKQHPNLWREMLLKVQTPLMMEVYDAIADALIENALYFFRDRIESAFGSRAYSGGNERQKRGKNDSIYERLDPLFTVEQAQQHSIAVKGAGVTHNCVLQMLKNWRQQGLIVKTEDGRFRKL